MDSYSGYPSDQCLTEVLDYWLRHHAGMMKWAEVAIADALKAVELNQLAEKFRLSYFPQVHKNATVQLLSSYNNPETHRVAVTVASALSRNIYISYEIEIV